MLALSYVQGLGVALYPRIVEAAGSATAIFDNLSDLSQVLPGASPRLVRLLSDPVAFERAEKELEFAEKHGIDIISYNDDNYPYRLRECSDAPIILYAKGNLNLNASHIVSVVGTRRATEYGKAMCEQFVADLAAMLPGTLVVSGLAYGIDIRAHRSALTAGLPTVGVLAHGLDRIYPSAHRETAKSMLANGGLLTEFMSCTEPFPGNFVRRNRIVAGLSDATVVIESAAKGGSLITASIANSYSRDCFAYPGRVIDSASSGCNKLIASNRAALITSAEDFVEAMNWADVKKNSGAKSLQMELFSNLSPEEETVMQYLAKYPDGVQINRMVVDTDIPISNLMTILFELEMKELVRPVAGGIYCAKNLS